jgi:hypothetical protein
MSSLAPLTLLLICGLQEGEDELEHAVKRDPAARELPVIKVLRSLSMMTIPFHFVK